MASSLHGNPLEISDLTIFLSSLSISLSVFTCTHYRKLWVCEYIHHTCMYTHIYIYEYQIELSSLSSPSWLRLRVQERFQEMFVTNIGIGTWGCGTHQDEISNLVWLAPRYWKHRRLNLSSFCSNPARHFSLPLKQIQNMFRNFLFFPFLNVFEYNLIW